MLTVLNKILKNNTFWTF